MKRRAIGMAMWALGLMLSLVLLFALARQINATVIWTCIFTLIAFVGMLVFLFGVRGRLQNADEQFFHLPASIIASGYMVIQIPICIVFALLSNVVSARVTIVVNVVVLILAWVFALSSVAGNDHIRKVNNRQKDHHTTL